MLKITPNIEDYLEAILQLSEINDVVRVKDIAEKLSVKNPSVTQQIQKLSTMKLVRHKSYGNVSLTDDGLEIAQKVLKRHRIFEDLLSNVLELPKEIAEKDACKMEHAVSSETMERLGKLLKFITSDQIKDKFSTYINTPTDN